MIWKKGQEVQLVPLTQATGRVLEVYREMQQVLGVPHISSFFQFLGNYPRFLDRFWLASRPMVQSEAFQSCAANLRADAYARVRTSFQVPDLQCEIEREKFSNAACEELRDCIIFFSYSVPASLVLCAYLNRAFTGPAGRLSVPATPAPPHRQHRRLVFVEEDSASTPVKGIFNDIRKSTGADVIHTVYRAFARWPNFLESYWTATKPIISSEHFLHHGGELRTHALRATDTLPGPVEFKPQSLAELGMNENEATSLIRISDMFLNSLSAALLNVSVARIAMETSTATAPVGTSERRS